MSESGLQRVIAAAFSLLELIAFFTAGEGKPAQSWHMRDGLTAWPCGSLALGRAARDSRDEIDFS